jgi:hypothetical protein
MFADEDLHRHASSPAMNDRVACVLEPGRIREKMRISPFQVSLGISLFAAQDFQEACVRDPQAKIVDRGANTWR